MAIAFDASSNGTISGSSSITVAHTCTGANLALVVAAACPNSSDFLSGATVTYNGVSMGSPRVSVSSFASLVVYVWVLAAPATGTHNIVITPTSSAFIDLIAASFTGVDQTTPVDATNSGTNGFAVSPFSTSITVSAGGVAVDMFSKRATAAGLTAGGAQTQVASTNDSVAIASMSYLAAATAMSWTFSDFEPVVAQAIVALKAGAGGGGGRLFRTNPSGNLSGLGSSGPFFQNPLQ